MENVKWDHAVAAALLILDLIDATPGGPRHVLAARAQEIIYVMLQSYDEQTERPHVTFSDN